MLYYPVLPKVDPQGEFYTDQLQGDRIPFGTQGRLWDEEDLYAPITSAKLPNSWINYSLIDLDFSAVEDGVFNDVGPISNYGILIDDYKLDYELGPVTVDEKEPTVRSKVDKKTDRKTF